MPNSIDIGDLVQDGVLGLIDAANRFDEGVMIEWTSADPWTFDEGPLLTYRIVITVLLGA